MARFLYASNLRTMKVLAILNRNAGSFEKAQALIESYKSRAEIDFQICESIADLPSCVRHAAGSGYDTLAACGGDGTIHTLVNAVGDDLSRFKIGIIPLGTGNDFGRSLGLPNDPAEALNLLLDGERTEIKKVDLIRVSAGEQRVLCVNVASGGFAGEIEKTIDKDLKQRWGALAYARAALGAATNIVPYEIELALDDQPPRKMSALNLVVANGKAAGGGFEVAPDADPADRRLDIVVVHPTSAAQMAAIATQLLVGDYTVNEAVTELRAKKAKILSCEPPMDFSVDGNLIGRTPIEFAILPGALKVVIEKGAMSHAAA